MKKKLMKIFLVVIPLAAVVLATTGNSVQLVNKLTGETVNASYFEMLQDTTVGVCPPLAATCGIFSLITGILFQFLKKSGLIKASGWCAFAGACLAVIPIAARGDLLLLPNVLFPILLLGQFVLCQFAGKLDLTTKDLPQGRRLERH